MIDDILDITQDSSTLGKPAMLDFVEGKVTIPYLFLHQRIEDKQKLESMYKKSLRQEEIAWIKEQMNTTHALQDAILQAKTLGNEAIEALKDENTLDLVMIMKAMIEREF
jgi:octaprenyl-diphosphate synthase